MRGEVEDVATHILLEQQLDKFRSAKRTSA